MLFSHEETAAFVSTAFEPVWESLRPAPQVTIDFGGGRVVRRTLRGNVLTWVLDAEGRAVDVVPGVMTPAAYRARLEEAARLAAWTTSLPADERAARLRAAHADEARRVAAIVAPTPAEDAPADVHGAKTVIESPVERAVRGGDRRADAAKHEAEAPAETAVSSAATLRDAATLLAEDTLVNTTTRRAAAHALLADVALTPLGSELTRRAYRTLVGVDLDDPWLGLGETLFADYPFAR